MFHDRAEAGRQLAEKLVPLVSGPAVVAGIPRGGLAVALPVVERLRVPLTAVYARKLTSPSAPELAFGAVDEDGETLLDPSTVALLDLTHDDIEAAKTKVRAEIQRRMTLYGVPSLAHYLPECSVILVDDGLATGLTMRAALRYARRHGAREIIVAAPCAAARTAERFRQEADRFLSLIVDENFYAVGQYYIDFPQVSDAEVVAMLERARALVTEADRQHPV